MTYRDAAVLAVLLLAACSREGPTSYKVPKEKEPAAPMGGEMPGPMVAPAGGGEAGVAPRLHWHPPAGWKELPGAGMRLASFVVPGPGGAEADLSVVTLPGDAGGDLANVNRWRGQIGLEPLDAKGLSTQSRRSQTKAGTLLIVEYAGPKGHLHAAILNSDGSTWFFKLTGPDAAVTAARSDFLAFLSSLHFAGS